MVQTKLLKIARCTCTVVTCTPCYFMYKCACAMLIWHDYTFETVAIANSSIDRELESCHRAMQAACECSSYIITSIYSRWGFRGQDSGRGRCISYACGLSLSLVGSIVHHLSLTENGTPLTSTVVPADLQ